MSLFHFLVCCAVEQNCLCAAPSCRRAVLVRTRASLCIPQTPHVRPKLSRESKSTANLRESAGHARSSGTPLNLGGACCLGVLAAVFNYTPLPSHLPAPFSNTFPPPHTAGTLDRASKLLLAPPAYTHLVAPPCEEKKKKCSFVVGAPPACCRRFAAGRCRRALPLSSPLACKPALVLAFP